MQGKGKVKIVKNDENKSRERQTNLFCRLMFARTSVSIYAKHTISWLYYFFCLYSPQWENDEKNKTGRESLCA